MMYSEYNLKEQTFVWKLAIFSKFVLTPSPPVLNRQSLLRNSKVFCKTVLIILYTFMFPETPVKALCLMMQSFDQFTLLVHSSGMLTVDSTPF